MSLAGSRVLITGGLGFIGSNLAIRLARDGARVCLMSLSNPYPDIDINIKGTAALLEACRKKNPGVLVVRSGTRGQYGPAVRLPVSEEAPSDPRGLYEISQLSAEMICRTYTRIHGIRTVPLRLTNIYGPRGQMRHPHFGVVNWFVRLALEGRPIPIFGTGKILRDFLYVDDCVEALVRAAGAPAAVGEIVNVGDDRASTFLEVAQILCELVPGARIEFTDFTPERLAQEPGDFVSDVSKIRRLLGWRPVVDLREGLSKTVAFYRERRADYF